MTDYNVFLSTLLKLVNEAFDLEGLNDFCFLYFRPVYDEFADTDRKKVRVRMLVDYAERRGQLDHLLTRLKAENPGKYNQYASQLTQPDPSPPSAIATPESPPATSGGSVFNQTGQTVRGNQYNVAGDLAIGSGFGQGSGVSGLEPDQRDILRFVYEAVEKTPNRAVADILIAAGLGFDIEDVRMHLDLLKEKRLVELKRSVGSGPLATLTAQGRLMARKLGST